MLNVRKIADIAQKMFNFPFFSPRCYFSLLNELHSDSIGIIAWRGSLSSLLLRLLLIFCQNDFIIHLIHFCTNVERFMPE